MDALKYFHKFIGIALAIALLMGCATLVATPPLPPPPTGTPQMTPNTPLLPPPTAQQELFKFIQTVQVTPDDKVLDGGFIRLGYVPALDRIVAVFKSWKLTTPEGGCQDGGHLYKVYTIDMQPTGESGVLNCGKGGEDSSALFVENVLYDVHFSGEAHGWRITKYDAVTWKPLAQTDYPMNNPDEIIGDMMIELVNGMLDISSMVAHPSQNPSVETATHHNFFTPDLQFLNRRILADTQNIEGSSMIFVDEKYQFVTGNDIHREAIVMQYDRDWKYLGMKVLLEHATWPEWVAFDGQRYYVAYMDTSLNIGTDWAPLYTNIHLAAFDRD